jgi:hypothetical protein
MPAEVWFPRNGQEKTADLSTTLRSSKIIFPEGKNAG